MDKANKSDLTINKLEDDIDQICTSQEDRLTQVRMDKRLLGFSTSKSMRFGWKLKFQAKKGSEANNTWSKRVSFFFFLFSVLIGNQEYIKDIKQKEGAHPKDTRGIQREPKKAWTPQKSKQNTFSLAHIQSIKSNKEPRPSWICWWVQWKRVQTRESFGTSFEHF